MTGSTDQWQAAKRAYAEAAARVEAETDEARVDALVDEQYGKFWEGLMSAPAPTLSIVIEKLEFIRGRYGEDGFPTPDCDTDAIIADLRRLDGEARS